MIEKLLGATELVGCGIVAGVLFAVALSVLPAMMAMPPDRYIYAHKLIGRNWDPTMPIIVLTTTFVSIALAVLARTDAQWLWAVSAVLLLGVSTVSHLCNVPLNRRVKVVDPQNVPSDWHDPRLLWRRYHMLRTVLAILALLTTSAAMALPLH